MSYYKKLMICMGHKPHTNLKNGLFKAALKRGVPAETVRKLLREAGAPPTYSEVKYFGRETAVWRSGWSAISGTWFEEHYTRIAPTRRECTPEQHAAVLAALKEVAGW